MTPEQFELADKAGEVHGKLVEAQEALYQEHEARAALLVSEALDDMAELSGAIQDLEE